MSGLVSIRPFFRTKLLSLGLSEWTDAFNVENIPSTMLDRRFHIETPTGSRRGAYDQNHQELEQDVIIRIFLKGYRDPASAVDSSLGWLDSVMSAVLPVSARAGASIKNIYINRWSINPIAGSNDNALVLEITFNCFIIFA